MKVNKMETQRGLQIELFYEDPESTESIQESVNKFTKNHNVVDIKITSFGYHQDSNYDKSETKEQTIIMVIHKPNKVTQC